MTFTYVFYDEEPEFEFEPIEKELLSALKRIIVQAETKLAKKHGIEVTKEMKDFATRVVASAINHNDDYQGLLEFYEDDLYNYFREDAFKVYKEKRQ